MAEQQPQPHTPHVVILPLPAQGHVKPMFNLAQLLCLHDPNLKVTFVNSIHNHDGLLNSISDLSAFHDRFPGLRFESLSDGPPPVDRSRVSSDLSRRILDMFLATVSVTKPLFRELMIELIGRRREAPPTCVIADGMMSFAIDVAEEVGVPIITFRTYSAACTWVYFHIQKLIQDGQIPFPENEDMNRPINGIPGFENILRRRDLPSICRIQEVENPILQFYLTQTSAMTRASALILNTFHELEAPTVSRLASLFPKVYTIGPLHAFLNTQVNASSSPSDSSDGSLRQQDKTCMTWLDNQPSKSVVYVSFGSIVTLTRDQLLEFWSGVVNSGKPFLWVIRKNLITGGDSVGQIPVEIQEATEERGCIVDWAPQEEVLAHRAIGGFLTHSGWNSTLESIYAGVPMIGWPQIADQQVNSRCVSELWRIGADMKDTCDRFTVEKMVRELMEGDHREVIVKSTDEIAKLARDSVKQEFIRERNRERRKKMDGGIMPHHSNWSSPSRGFNGTGMHMHRKMMMHMTFFWGKHTEILFSGWPGSSSGMYALSLIFVFVLAVLVEFLSHCKLIKPEANKVAAGLFQTALHAVRVGLAYMVMLAVMSFNGGVFLAAVAGHAIGFAVFGSRIFEKSVPLKQSDLPPLKC